MKYEPSTDLNKKQMISFSNSQSNQKDTSELETISKPTSINSSKKPSFPPSLNHIIFQSPLSEIKNQKVLSFSSSMYSLSPNSLRTSTIKILPPKSKKYLNKKTLILDLDETLVHSSFLPGKHKPDIILNIDFVKRENPVYVLVRPGMELFLERLYPVYELIVFTASVSKYANPLIDILDKKKRISHRLFRENCTFVKNSFVKDLSQINRDLKDVILVDNNPTSYSVNIDNGFPIKTWIDDKGDRELIKIIPLLNHLSKVPDVRQYIKHMNKHNDFSLTRASELDEENNKLNQIGSLNIINQVKNDNLDKDKTTDSFSNNKDNKYNISIVNNNYLQVYINSSNQKEISSPIDNLTNTTLTKKTIREQIKNAPKLKKNKFQYKLIVPNLIDKLNRNNPHRESRSTALNDRNKKDTTSDYKTNQRNTITKYTNYSPVLKLKQKQFLEINQFRSNNNSNNNSKNISNNNSYLKKKLRFNPSTKILNNCNYTPMMNYTKNFKQKITRYDNHLNEYNKRNLMNDPFLKQGYSTSRSTQSIFNNMSNINYSISSMNTTQKLKYGLLLRNSTAQSKFIINNYIDLCCDESIPVLLRK